MRAPLAPPRRSLPRKLDADAQAVVTSWEIERPEARIFALSASMSCSLINSMIDGGDWVLPDQLFLGNERAEVAVDRAHVAVGELVPGSGEGVGELVGILVEVPRDLLVGGVGLEGDVAGEHGWRATF